MTLPVPCRKIDLVIDGESPTSDPDMGAELTLKSYDATADCIRESHAPRGRHVEFLEAFASGVGSGTVLELGSGPGWDADQLERPGLAVIRTDGAPAFVERLRNQGHEAWVLDVRKDPLGGPYEGVLANAILLHLSRKELLQVLGRVHRAVREPGLFGFTLKEGDGDAWTDAKIGLPRHFVYWREPELRSDLSAMDWRVVSIEHVSGRRDDWLYVLATPR